MSILLWILADTVLALAALLSFLFVGTAALKLTRSRLIGLPLLAYGAGVGVLIHGLVGLAVALSPAKQATACGLLLGCWGMSILAFRRARSAELPSAEPPFGRQRGVRPTLAILGLFVTGCVALTHLQIPFPPALPEEIFPFREHALPVKMQLLLGTFPVDNYIPYVVEEFLARDISFAREHPIIPGQEVSNRPILLALVVVPFRVAIDPPPTRSTPLERFTYAGLKYPDTGVFTEGPGYREFLDVAIALNALVLLGAALLFVTYLPDAYLVAGLLLMATAPFYLWETIFAWPKLLAAFYLLLALHVLIRRENSALVALWGGLAYWAHPYGLVFLLGFGCHYAWGALATRRRADVTSLLRYGAVAALILAPWLLWTRWFLHLPSDLVAQNLKAQEAQSLFDQVWTRVANFYEVISPRMFGVEPFQAEIVFQDLIRCLPGVLGLLVVPAYVGCVTRLRADRALLVYGIFIPALLMLLPFNKGTLIMLMGYHPISVCLLLVGLLVLTTMKRSAGLALIVGQILLQLTMLFVHARVMHATFSTHGVIYQMLAHRPVVKGAERQVELHERVTANGEEVASIWAEPPASFVYRNIHLPAGKIHFRCRITIHPAVWNVPESDGAEFILEVRRHGTDGMGKPVWSTTLDPGHHPEARRWHTAEVDLSMFAGKTVDLALKTGTGPAGNGTADWCVWGDPVLSVE